MKFSTITVVLLALVAKVLVGGIQVSPELARDVLDAYREFRSAVRGGVDIETAAADFFDEVEDVLAAARGATGSRDGYGRPNDNESKANKEAAEALKAIKARFDWSSAVAVLGVGAGIFGTGVTFLIFLHSIGCLSAWFYAAEKRY